jgi:hypothetical protein
MPETRNPKIQTSDVETELQGELEDRDDTRREGEQVEQQDLNQGMDTGTHGSERHGVNWGPSYRTKRASSAGSKNAKRQTKKR